MKKVFVILALLALAFTPAVGWSAGISDDVNRDTTPGDIFEVSVVTPVGPVVLDPIATQEAFYVVRGADGVIYYTIRDLCADNLAACGGGIQTPNAGVRQQMAKVGFLEVVEFGAALSALNGGTGVPPTGISFGPAVGTPEADFGGEFFAGTNIISATIGALGGPTVGPGINGDPVLSQMGDANTNGWPGAAGETPWAPLPTGQTADNDPAIHYMTSTFPNQWSVNAGNYLAVLQNAFFSDPLRSQTPISPFDLIIDVRGDDGTIYRTAYNLNAVLVPPAVPVPAIPVFNAGTGAAMAYVDRQFPSDVTGACNIGDGFPGCASRFNPNTGVLVNDSGQQQTPWRAVTN